MAWVRCTGGGKKVKPDYYLIKDGNAQVPFTGGAVQRTGYVELEMTSYPYTYKSFNVTDVDISEYNYLVFQFSDRSSQYCELAVTVGGNQTRYAENSGTRSRQLIGLTSPTNIGFSIGNNVGTIRLINVKLTNTL